MEMLTFNTLKASLESNEACQSAEIDNLQVCQPNIDKGGACRCGLQD